MDATLVNTDQTKVDRTDYFNAVKKGLEERDKSMITDMFQGIVGDCITCQTCKKPKYKYETELILSLPLGDSQNRTVSRRTINRAQTLTAT